MIPRLEPALNRSETQPPNGGIFIPECDTGAVEVVDFTKDILQINKIAAALTNSTRCMLPRVFAVNEELKELREQTELYEAVAGFGNLVEASAVEDVWFLDTPTVLARSESRSALINDYKYAPPNLFIVPGRCITAAKALLYPHSTTENRPVLDLRIQTSADKPISFFEDPGNVANRPGLGAWFRLPLADLKLAILSEQPRQQPATAEDTPCDDSAGSVDSTH